VKSFPPPSVKPLRKLYMEKIFVIIILAMALALVSHMKNVKKDIPIHDSTQEVHPMKPFSIYHLPYGE